MYQPPAVVRLLFGGRPTAAANQIHATDVTERAALDALRAYGEHSSAFLAFNRHTRHFRAAGDRGLVAYRPAGRRHVAQLFGPIAPISERRRLLTEFRGWARQEGRRVMAVQLTRADAELYAAEGFVVNQLGSSYSIALDGYATRGSKFMKIRNKLKRAAREGVTIQAMSADEAGEPALKEQLDAIDADWLKDKGAHELAFMIGERGGRGQSHRRVFLASHHGRPVAYVTYSPVFGERPGWLYDLTRRRPDAPTGTIELLFHTALTVFQSEQCEWLHLGLTPFAGLSDEHELSHGTSRLVRATVRQIAQRGEFLYPAATQEAFKRKWQPQHTEPEYIAFDRRVSAGAVWQLLRLTGTV
jgi:lysylphosphatidylglycerol synthetase-like protein (DUF2156 family)